MHLPITSPRDMKIKSLERLCRATRVGADYVKGVTRRW